MLQLPAVPVHQEPTDVLLCHRGTQVTEARHPFRLEITEQSLRGKLTGQLPRMLMLWVKL